MRSLAWLDVVQNTSARTTRPDTQVSCSGHWNGRDMLLQNRTPACVWASANESTLNPIRISRFPRRSSVDVRLLRIDIEWNEVLWAFSIRTLCILLCLQWLWSVMLATARLLAVRERCYLWINRSSCCVDVRNPYVVDGIAWRVVFKVYGASNQS